MIYLRIMDNYGNNRVISGEKWKTLQARKKRAFELVYMFMKWDINALNITNISQWTKIEYKCNTGHWYYMAK